MSSRTRGEGYVEYAIVLSVIMICSIVGLMTAGSETVKGLQYASGICDGCPKPKPAPAAGTGPGAPTAPGGEAPATPTPVEGPETSPGGDAPSGEPSPTIPDPSYSGTSGGTLPGDPNASTMGVFAKIWGWFTGMWA